MRRLASILLVLACAACSGGTADSPNDGGGSVDAGDVLAGTSELDVAVPASGRVYVKLAQPSVVTPAGDGGASTDWDLAFEGYDVFTNSGASGPGQGGAFGGLDLGDFGSDAAPTVPFISADKAGGAFVDWYAYEGTNHVLYSRYHVYGVKRGGRTWKVQLLSYYGEQDHAPTSALYQLRYAELGGATQTLQVDGTAGGLSAPATAPSGCLDLAAGTVSPLTVADAQASTAWDLCFRRDAVSVNGEAGGPGGVGAVDLQAADTASETLAQVEDETADGERARFDAADASAFAGATFRGDHVVSAFETGAWLDTTQSPFAPKPLAWLVVDASGQQKFLVAFTAFQNATTSSPGTVVVHLKPVSG